MVDLPRLLDVPKWGSLQAVRSYPRTGAKLRPFAGFGRRHGVVVRVQ